MPSAISQQVLGLATSTSPGLAQAGGYNILPAGIVFPYAGGTAPTGFLLCEGQQISKTAYAALYASIGDDYATQIDPTTGLAWAAPDADKFRVPDYRGLFLRGVGTPNGLDAVTRGTQQADKTKPNSLAIGSSTAAAQTGTAAGQTQATSNISLASGSATSAGSHDHLYTQPFANYGVDNRTATALVTKDGASGIQTDNEPAHTHPVSGTTNIGHTHAASAVTLASSTVTFGAITGDTETRPINKGVHYIIKA
ncbi:MAG: phage tail protein [Ilumatobacteraceae bacterium]